jgi:RimJ/RimL family protein N-acetyltransferase
MERASERRLSMDAATPILETPRLQLRRVALADSAFFLKLLNDPSWLAHIGDRGVHSDADAENYIRSTIWAQYEAHQYGMYAAQLKSTALVIGICGLVKRDFLSAPDLGFALLPDHTGRGYATEAARAMMSHAQKRLRIARLYAIVTRSNERSVRLLERLGFRYEGPFVTPQGVEVELYTTG